MGGGLFDTTERQQVYIALNLITTVIGSTASIITLLVISRMRLTGHILLILTMTCYQLMYDMTFFFANVNIGYWWLTAANSCQIVSGVAGSFISNYIAYIAFYVVYNRKSYRVFDNYLIIFLTSLLPGIANAILLLVGSIPRHAHRKLVVFSIVGIYYPLRLLSIILNFAFCGFTVYFTQRMTAKKHSLTEAEVAIRTLSRRMIYYPILQAVGRSGYAWYEAAYGAQIESDNPSTTQYAALIFLTIITPTVSIGYLAILLIMQPHAYEEFKKLFCLQSSAASQLEEKQPTSCRDINSGNVESNSDDQERQLQKQRLQQQRETVSSSGRSGGGGINPKAAAADNSDFSTDNSSPERSSLFGASILSVMSDAFPTYGDWGDSSSSNQDANTASSLVRRFSHCMTTAPLSSSTAAAAMAEYSLFDELEEEELIQRVDFAYARSSGLRSIDGRFHSSRCSSDAQERLLPPNSADYID